MKGLRWLGAAAVLSLAWLSMPQSAPAGEIAIGIGGPRAGFSFYSGSDYGYRGYDRHRYHHHHHGVTPRYYPSFNRGYYRDFDYGYRGYSSYRDYGYYGRGGRCR